MVGLVRTHVSLISHAAAAWKACICGDFDNEVDLKRPEIFTTVLRYGGPLYFLIG
jgi:hypothetical protein